MAFEKLPSSVIKRGIEGLEYREDVINEAFTTSTVITVDQSVYDFDLSPFYKYVAWCPASQYFDLPAGTEHYRLLAYLAAYLPTGAWIADLGTQYGMSAVALASRSDVTVHTYDPSLMVPPECRSTTFMSMRNVRFTQDDCLKRVEEFSNADLVMLDVDPHDGKQEAMLIHMLKSESFRGLLIMDDIHLNPKMDELWNAIALPKHDLTIYGHWSGTGAVVFDPSHIDLEVEGNIA